MMGITYLGVDVIYTIVFPGFEVAHELKEVNTGILKDEKDATLQFADDMEVQLILLFNLQMIFFYNKTSFNVSQFI